jgi:hypothetical protein
LILLKDSHITYTIDNSNKFENQEDEFMKAMQTQLNYNTDNSISQGHFGCIEKLKELDDKKN